MLKYKKKQLNKNFAMPYQIKRNIKKNVITTIQKIIYSQINLFLIVIKIETPHPIESEPIGRRVLHIDQRRVAVLEEAAVRVRRPRRAIGHAVRPRIKRLELPTRWQHFL